MSEGKFLSLIDVLQRLKQWKLCFLKALSFHWYHLKGMAQLVECNLNYFFKFMDDRNSRSSFILYFYAKFIERMQGKKYSHIETAYVEYREAAKR